MPSPVASATTLLLDASWVCVNVTCFAKVARKVVFWEGSAVGEASVVAVVLLVGASHC